MSCPELTKHPRWPLYRKVRRYARNALRNAGKAFEASDIDVYLAAELPGIRSDLLQLYLLDVSERGEGERTKRFLALGNSVDGSLKL